MAHIICEPCIGTKDASCVTACPVACIYEADDQLVIAPSECVDCGACIAACPVSAIVADYDVPTEWASYIEKNATLAKGTAKAAA